MGGSSKKREGLKEREVGLLAFGIALGSVSSFYLIPIVREELTKTQTPIGELLTGAILVLVLTVVIGVGLKLANTIYQRI